VLNLSRLSSTASFSQQSMSVVTSFGRAVGRRNRECAALQHLEGLLLGTITALAPRIDARTRTPRALHEVTDAALAIADEMGSTASNAGAAQGRHPATTSARSEWTGRS